MKEQLITFETAKLAKEKGFNISSLNNYSEYLEDEVFNDPRKGHEITLHKKGEVILSVGYPDVKYKSWQAPTQSLLKKWLRKTYNINVVVTNHIIVNVYKDGEFIDSFSNEKWIRNLDFYEEALEKGLQEALKLVKS